MTYSSNIENTYTTLWRHTNLCSFCQMRENMNAFFNKEIINVLQGKGSQIQINNKTIIEFGFRRKWGIIKASKASADNTNLCLNNSSYPTRPHSIIVYYNTAFVNSERWLAKSRVDITLCQHGNFLLYRHVTRTNVSFLWSKNGTFVRVT